MHHMRLRDILLAVMCLLALMTSACFTLVHYQTQKRTLLRDIDARLLTAALFTRATLPADYHDRITGPTSVTEAQYREIVARNNALCRELQLQYLWSVMAVEGKIVFTAGTATSKDISRGDFARFFEVHSDPGSFARVLKTMQVDYSSFGNKWGMGRMVLVPARDRHGRPFVFGASVSLTEVNGLLRQTLWGSLGISLGVLLLGIALSFVLANRLAQPITTLRAVAQRIAAGEAGEVAPVGGSAELLSLSESIARMQEAIQTQLTALRTSREDLRITLDSIGDGVIATDTAGRVTRVNRVAQALTGWTQEEAVGQPLTEVFQIVNGHTRESAENPVERVLREGNVVGMANDTLLLARGGSERQIADSAAPIRLCDTSEILGVVLVFRDVTDRYRLEAQMRQAYKMESVGRLAGGVAHDFNNMLCGITGYANMLGVCLAGQHPLSDYVGHILEATQRAASLTHKLLAFSRQGPLTRITLDVHQAIIEVLSIFERTIDRRIEIVTRLEATPPTIVCDPSQVQNSLLNICLNARDAMPEGGTLTLATSTLRLEAADCAQNAFELHPGNYLLISISDTGVGIPESLREMIFDPFFTTKDVGAGTGLGLAGVYAMVKEHHGAVSVYSEVGHGTVFHLLLPISTEPAAAPLPVVRELIPGTGTILFVDDEPILRELGHLLLTELGYTVLLAEDGQEAVAIYRERWQAIDLVILDIVMPKLNGPEAFLEMRTINPALRALLSSGFARNTSIDALLEAGVAGFIHKPYDSITLSQAVATARVCSTDG
jgi:PAS domain S-box-containing protein